MEGLYKNGGAKTMKKNFLFILLFTFCVLISCSTTHSVIKKNRLLVNKETDYLYQKKGNAFYLSSTYSYYSIVWSYDKESIEIYKLQKGAMKQKQVFKEKEKIQYAGISLVDIEKELYQKCAFELDGVIFGFIIEVDGKRYNVDYAVDINCLKQQEYDSVFLNKISNDIKYYKMWEIQPQ